MHTSIPRNHASNKMSLTLSTIFSQKKVRMEMKVIERDVDVIRYEALFLQIKQNKMFF